MVLRLHALALAATLALASAATLTPPRRLRYGIVGTGCIGLEHIRNLHLVDEAELVAIADPHAPSIEAARAVLSELSIDEAGVAICAGYEELLALPQVDAVVVCTPNDHHIHVLRAALPTGKDCLVEKLTEDPELITSLRWLVMDKKNGFRNRLVHLDVEDCCYASSLMP